MSRVVKSSLCVSLLVALCFILAVPLSAQVMIVRENSNQSVSPALRELPVVGVSASFQVPKEAEPARRIPLPDGLKPVDEPDPVRQTAVMQPTADQPQLLAPTLLNQFEGLGTGTQGFSVLGAPPDTNGAPGLTQYVQWVNTSVAVFDKTTGAILAGPILGNSLFTNLGGDCAAKNSGDPIVLYDKLANRWVLSQFAINTTAGAFHQCVAVSTSSDATGTYNIYSFDYSTFDDYPKMGTWPDAYYTTFNMFSGNFFVGGDVCAYDRNAMLNGQAATQICFQQGNSVGGLLPSDVDGTTAPPAGSPNYVLMFGSNNLQLFKFHVDFTTPVNSTFTGPIVIPVAAFSPLCGGGTCVPQPGTNTQLDSLADRLMYRLAYRNFGDHESLVVNHSVALNGGGGGIRWYELQNPNGNSPTLAQQSTFAPDLSYRWMGSIAMDRAGDMALGYTISTTLIHPSILFTGRSASDPASTMQTEATMFSGSGSQTTRSNGTALTRWGDYSAMQVDPSDDCTFWYTSEYLHADGVFNWNTRIGNFKFSGCGGLRFIPVTPCRIVDTRNPTGPFGGPFLGANTSRSFAIPSSACNIPANAQAYALNYTVVPKVKLAFLTTYPCGQSVPLVSTLNSDGRIKAGAAITPAGTSGAVCVFATDDTELVMDISGYFVSSTTANSLAFFPVTPCRVVDTRNATSALGGPSMVGNAARTFPVLSSPCNLPAGAAAYAMNFTTVPKVGHLDFLTTWPAGQSQPLVSTLNSQTGTVTANAAIVPAGTNGDINVFVTDNSDLVIDVNGYFAPPAQGGLSFFNLAPCRVLDTRVPSGSPPFVGALQVNVSGSGCSAPASAQAYVLNATVVPPGPLDFLTMWNGVGQQPLVSTLNASDAAITSNMAITPAHSGSVGAFVPQQSHLVLDITGYFAP